MPDESQEPGHAEEQVMQDAGREVDEEQESNVAIQGGQQKEHDHEQQKHVERLADQPQQNEDD